jgi:hypothetical protein
MFCRINLSIFVVATFVADIVNPVLADTCTPGSVPVSWSAQTGPTESLTPTDMPNPITLIMLRHGEKLVQNGEFLENGNMSEVGKIRAQRLPVRLKKLFGCPDTIVAPDPNEKIPYDFNDPDTQYFYYVRPAGTIEPTAASLAYPLWMPYGAMQRQELAADLLTAPEFAPPDPNDSFSPQKIFIAWEHENIVAMTSYIIETWGLSVFPRGQRLKVNGKTYRCESVPDTWDSCDYDSIWVLNIQGRSLCYTHMHEKLNNAAYQESCKKAENKK